MSGKLYHSLQRMNYRDRLTIADENELIQNKLTDPHERLIRISKNFSIHVQYCRVMFLYGGVLESFGKKRKMCQTGH
jgi:hypothetical protein